MGGSESKEEEVEYNHLKEQVQQWDEADAVQMLQIESFHRSIAVRSSMNLGEQLDASNKNYDMDPNSQQVNLIQR